jgi:WD40 repeat protein
VCLISALLAAVLSAAPLSAQPNCPLPPAIQAVSHEQNIFSDQQEVDLGDAMAESLARGIRIIDDDKLNAHLREIGDRLVEHLPPNQMKFRFTLVELSEANAFSIAGGRVYVARKMVALAHTDDELAGVLAHELGHIVTHQSGIEMTARLRELLGVTQVGDRADVFEKFHEVLENEGRKPGRGGEEEDKQYTADQVALYAMARAGYAPHAYIDLWDRFQQTHGKTGSWLSNLLGASKPSERRLGVMLKNVAVLPSGCADLPPGSRTAEFAKWQAEVIAYSGFGTKESLPGLVFKQTLSRPLRPDVTHLRFSPDGKYILSQDEGGIHVLTRDPFAVLFYIPAVGARRAQFAPDSRSIVFYNSSLRVETWSIAGQQRSSVHELTILYPCFQNELSSDGSTLACLSSEMELSLIDVQTGSTIVSKKNFVRWDYFTGCAFASSLLAGEGRVIAMGFSPDARYFLAAHHGVHFAWDLNAQREINLPGSIKDITDSSFAFLGPDRIVGLDANPKKSSVLRFPTGERLQRVALGSRLVLTSATQGDYFFVSPLKNDPMGLVDLKTEKLAVDFKHPAADVYGTTLVTEQISGELVLHSLENISADSAPLAVVKLPQARLSPPRAVAISPDFNWMAISQNSRGAVWDVTHNIRTMELGSFQGAWFAPDQAFYVDLSKFMETERAIARLNPSLGRGSLGYKIGDAVASQHGPYLLISKARARTSNQETDFWFDFGCMRVILNQLAGVTGGGPIARNEDVELHDVRDGRLVWSRYFPKEVPVLSIGAGNVLLRWPVKNVAARDELAKYPELKKTAADNDYLLEQVDLHNDSVIARLVISTHKGSFKVEHAFVEGDSVIVSASGDQVLTYSLSGGQEKGHFFGTNPAVSSNGLIAVENEASQLSLYDLASSQLKRQYSFADPILFKTFSPDGNRMFVFTADQTAFILDLTSKDVTSKAPATQDLTNKDLTNKDSTNKGKAP